MVEKIVRYLLLSMLGLSALIFVVTLILDDKTIESTSGPAAETLIEMKHDVFDTVSDKSDKFVYWIRTTIHEIINFSPTDRTPRVVMRVPPPPEKMEPVTPSGDVAASQMAPMPEEKSEPAAVPQAEALPVPLAEAAHKAPVEPATHEPSKTAEKLPEQDHTTASPMPSAMGHAPNVPEGAPEPAPVAPVSEQPLHEQAAGEQASLPSAIQTPPPADAPPPAPAIEEAKPGEADYQQGVKYYKGNGVEQNFGKAAQFFLKAAEAGHVGAQYNLGIMNYSGQTGGQDFTNAAKWFERAANNGHAQAQYNLGFLYYEGKGVEQNLKTAFDWINRAAEQGYNKAIKARDAFKKAMPEMFTAASDTDPKAAPK